MSHGGEEENYWPGYVDALTSMVQVLAFVMMMLAMAVFVLSQSVAKSAVEAIAKAVNADVKPDTNVKQLTDSVLEKLSEMRKTSSDPATSPSAAAPAPAPAAAPAEVQVRSDTERVARLSVGPQRTQSDHVAAQAPADAPRVTVSFEDKSYRIDKERVDNVVKFISENKAVEKADLVFVNAFAFTGDGALTEARRLAYYRAMMARKQLLDAKVLAENVRITVLDTTERTKGSTVEIVAGSGAKQ